MSKKFANSGQGRKIMTFRLCVQPQVRWSAQYLSRHCALNECDSEKADGFVLMNN